MPPFAVRLACRRSALAARRCLLIALPAGLLLLGAAAYVEVHVGTQLMHAVIWGP